MAGMTPTQVEQIVNYQQGPSDPSIPDLPPGWSPTGGSGATTNSAPPYFIAAPDQSYDPSTAPAGATPNNPYGDEISVLDPTGRYTTHFYPPTKTHGAYGYVEDKATGGTRPMTAAEIGAFSGGGAGGFGGTGADHYATDVGAATSRYATDVGAQTAAAQLQYEYSQLEEKRREFGLTFPEQVREFDIQQELARQQQQATVLQNRATTGMNLAQFQQSLANDAYKRAQDPGNFPAYLAASAGLQRSGSAPIDQLLGQGVQIQQPEGGNPYADPRFQNLMDQLYGYAQPQSISAVQNIAANNGGTLPQSFYDYTGTQNPQAHATGGTQMLTEPVLGIGLHSGRPQFLAGEAGKEKLTFTPQVHSHSDGGQPIPHSHDRGDQKHEHMDRNSPAVYADGGTAQIDPYQGGPIGPVDPTVTPAAPPPGGPPQSSIAQAKPPGQYYGFDTPEIAMAMRKYFDAANAHPNSPYQAPFVAPTSQPTLPTGDLAGGGRGTGGNAPMMTTNSMTTSSANPTEDFFQQWPTYTGEQQQKLRQISISSPGSQLTPAQGTNVALGKGLQALGWVNNDLVQQLLSGESPTPGMVDEATLMRLPPSYRQLLSAAIRAQVGGSGLQDYADSQQGYAMPGLGSSYPSASYG